MNNQFASLPSESEISSLAQVSAEEVFEAPAAPALDALEIYATKVAAAKAALAQFPARFTRRAVYSAAVELHAAIHAECESAREAGRREHDAWRAL